MSFHEQIEKIKENWLIVLIVVLVFLFMLGSNVLRTSFGGMSSSMPLSKEHYDSDVMMAESNYGGGYYPSSSQDFAPDVEERKITKSASMSNEVERGNYDQAEGKFKAIVTSSESYLLSQNVRTSGTGLGEYKYGSYSIKVESEKYESVVSQLKEIGDVDYFTENAQDITGSYENKEIELEVENERLNKYNEIYDGTDDTNFKIQIIDMIFNQERKIKYLKDSINNMDQQVAYSSISFSITEKKSNYANIAFVKLSDLVKGFISSTNGVLIFIFWVAPWVIFAGIIWWIIKMVRHR